MYYILIILTKNDDHKYTEDRQFHDDDLCIRIRGAKIIRKINTKVKDHMIIEIE